MATNYIQCTAFGSFGSFGYPLFSLERGFQNFMSKQALAFAGFLAGSDVVSFVFFAPWSG